MEPGQLEVAQTTPWKVPHLATIQLVYVEQQINNCDTLPKKSLLKCWWSGESIMFSTAIYKSSTILFIW